MSKLILGIDVSKFKLDLYLLVGEDGLHVIFDNDAVGHAKLLRWLKRKAKGQPVHACLEATGRYAFGVAEALHAAGYGVSIVNPARPAAYAKSQLRRNKTDKVDAQLLADFCLTQNPAKWTPPRPELRQLQALVRLLEDLKHTRQTERNRLDGIQNGRVAQHLQSLIHYLSQQIRQVEQEIQEHIDQHPELKTQQDLLTTIPGIATLTAAKLLAEIPDIRNFDDARQLAAFAGLTPRHNQSGMSKRRSPITRAGSPQLRSALYMPAIVAKRYNPIIRSFCLRLDQNGKLPMEQVVAAMRKLLHIVYGVLRHQRPFDPLYHPFPNQPIIALDTLP